MSAAVASLSSLSMIGSFLFFMCCLLLVLRRGSGGKPAGYVTENWADKIGTATTDGPWTSRAYGSMRDKPYGRVCPKGQYVSDVIGFYGQGEHTNALQFWCFDPKTKKTTRVFKNPTCGKRDKPDSLSAFMVALTPIIAVVSAVLVPFSGGATAIAIAAAATAAGTAASVGMEIASGIDAHKDVLAPGSGRKLWDVVWTGSPYGYNAWSVREKDGEIQGLKLESSDEAASTGWIGGGLAKISGPAGPRMARMPTGKFVSQKCPSGYVITGVHATCGDRVDGIQFTCNKPGE
jgi:hypothetical protein